jgi:hypothetical protein
VPAASPQVTGVDIGSAQINASAAGFAPDSRGASVSVDVTFSPTPFGVVVGASGTITVTISAPAPPGGLTVNLVTGNSSVATVVPSVTIPAGQLSVPAAITGVVIGSTTLRAQGSGVTSATATINVTPPPPVNLGSSNHQLVGRDLQDEVVVSLGATPPGPVTVTITVTSTAIATVSTSAATAGGGTVVFDNVTTASVGTIFMQGRALGSTTVIARAAGYADDVVTVTVQPSGFVTFTGSFTTTTGAANPSIQINAARLDPATLNFAGTQAVRGGLTVSVPVTAVDQAGGPGVGTITTSPVVFTGTNVGFTEFDPAVVGTSVITVGVPPGFDTPNNFRQTTVTVGP